MGGKRNIMNSKEIVERTLDFTGPERVAHSFGDSDFRSARCAARTHETGWKQTGSSRWERTDVWGNTWGRVDSSSKGEVVKGVLEDISDMDSYEFPDYSHPEDYTVVTERRKEFSDKYLLGLVPGFAFNIARKMRKLDQYLIDLVIEEERMHTLHNRIDEMVEHMIRNYAAAGADGIMFCEDWGTQDQLLINPALWEKEFEPRFVKLCAIAHDCGIRVFMHSCGQTEAIVPGLIQAGIDVLQFDQPDLHGIDTLAGHQEENNITFWCPVDIQKTLQKRDETVIRTKAREMLDKLWKGRGGFIAGFYNDNTSIGLDPEWQEYASDEFEKRGIASTYE